MGRFRLGETKREGDDPSRLSFVAGCQPRSFDRRSPPPHQHRQTQEKDSKAEGEEVDGPVGDDGEGCSHGGPDHEGETRCKGNPHPAEGENHYADDQGKSEGSRGEEALEGR